MATLGQDSDKLITGMQLAQGSTLDSIQSSIKKRDLNSGMFGEGDMLCSPSSSFKAGSISQPLFHHFHGNNLISEGLTSRSNTSVRHPCISSTHSACSLRWLRARGWDVERAFLAICKHADWRIAMMPDGRIDEVSALVGVWSALN